MENKEGYLEFIASESYRHQIDIWYKTYNISREKTELFYDFLQSLYDLVEQTYLGSDVMSEETHQKSHFIWCWDKTIESFEKEKIYIKSRGGHFDYFWNFFLEAYYYPKIDKRIIKITEYFSKLFDFKHKKTRSELDILTEVYKLLEQNLKK
jgi:hypothetical protein